MHYLACEYYLHLKINNTIDIILITHLGRIGMMSIQRRSRRKNDEILENMSHNGISHIKRSIG